MIAAAEPGFLTAVLCLTGIPVLGYVVWRWRGVRPAPPVLGPVEPLVLVGVALATLVGYGACQLLIRQPHPVLAGAGFLVAFGLAYGIHVLFLARVFRGGRGARRWAVALVGTWAALPVVFGVAFLVQHLGGAEPQVSVRLILAREEGWAALALMAVTVAPVLEEVVFRGLLYAAFRKRWGVRAATIVTACLFGLVHEASAWAPMAVYGVFLAYLVEITGHYGFGILSHVCFNGLTVAQLVTA